MTSEVKFGTPKFKGADGFRDSVPPDLMRSKEHAGLLSRLLDQKAIQARGVSLVRKDADNPQLDIFNDVDKLRQSENLPLGSHCMRSLLSMDNLKRNKRNNHEISKKVEESKHAVLHDKEYFLAMLTEPIDSLEDSAEKSNQSKT